MDVTSITISMEPGANEEIAIQGGLYLGDALVYTIPQAVVYVSASPNPVNIATFTTPVTANSVLLEVFNAHFQHYVNVNGTRINSPAAITILEGAQQWRTYTGALPDEPPEPPPEWLTLIQNTAIPAMIVMGFMQVMFKSVRK